jgi:hypothetical protein
MFAAMFRLPWNTRGVPMTFTYLPTLVTEPHTSTKPRE